MSEEIAPGQFNFINSQLRMNENHAENQNEFLKMSLMVKNLVSCKIERIFNDIDHAKEDLKTRIKCAIESDESEKNAKINADNLAASLADEKAKIDQKISDSETKIGELDQQIKKLEIDNKANVDKLDQQIKELDDENKANAAKSEGKIADLTSKIAEIEKGKNSSSKESQDKIDELKNEMERINKEKEANKASSLKDIAALNNQITNLNTKTKSEIANSEKNIAALNSQITKENESKIATLTTENGRLKLEIAELKSQKGNNNNSTSAPSNADTSNFGTLKKENEALKKNVIVDSPSGLPSEALNEANKKIQILTQEIETLKKTSNVTNVTNVTNAASGDLQTQLAKAMAKIKELENAPKPGTNTNTLPMGAANNKTATISTNTLPMGANNNKDNNKINTATISTNTLPMEAINNNQPKPNNSKNTFTDFVIGHHTP